MPRFVILEHDYPELHWDLMLESENNLRTWKLLQNPDLLISSAEKVIKAEPSFDHRLIYLDYEGSISNERGSVKRFDFGSFDLLEAIDDHIILLLQGQKLSGLFEIDSQSLAISRKNESKKQIK